MMRENRILLVGGCGAGKTTLLDALVGRIILSNKWTSEITCVYNEEAYNERPTVYNCNNYIGVKFCSNLSKNRICFVDTPWGNKWNDIQILKQIILTNNITTILFVVSAHHPNFLEDYRALAKVSEGIKSIVCLTRCDDSDPEIDDVFGLIDYLKKDIKTQLSEVGINNPTIVTVSPLRALIIKREYSGDCSIEDHWIAKWHDEEALFHLDRYCDNVVEDDNNEFLKHTGILNLETLIYEDRKN